MFWPHVAHDHATLSMRQPLMPVVLFSASTRQFVGQPTLSPVIRKLAFEVTVTLNESPLTVVAPIPCPWTLMFLFDQDTCPAEHVPAPMLTTSASADELIADCSADVMVPEHATSRTVPPNCAEATPGARRTMAHTSERTAPRTR